MQIEKIHITNYKILKNFKLDHQQQISVFVGVNGSGKSTILEALALIFSVAYEQIISKRKIVSPIKDCFIDYTLRFENFREIDSMTGASSTDYVPVKLTVNEDGEIVTIFNIDETKEPDLYKYLSKKYKPKDLLPQRVVIYYSGISDHMHEIYQITENNILKQLRTNPQSTKDGYVLPVSIPLFLFQPEDYNILLASLFSFGFNTRIDSIFYSKLKIERPVGPFIEIEIFRKEFDKDFERSRRSEIEQDLILIEDNDGDADLLEIRNSMLKRLENDRIENFFGASGRLAGFLRQMRETSQNKSESYDPLENRYIFRFTLGQWQTLAEDVLKDPKKIFEFLFMLKHNGLLKSVSITLIKNKIEIDSSFLSEGEKQLIIISALNEVIGINNSLFLFDEPDNFLHPSLQDDLVRNIEENYGDGEFYQNHYFVTTHNPSFLNNLDPEKGELNIIAKGKILPHKLKWFGRDVNEVIHQIMNSEYRPSWALKAISEIDKLIDDNDIEAAKSRLSILAERFSETDSEIVRLQAKLEFFID